MEVKVDEKTVLIQMDTGSGATLIEEKDVRPSEDISRKDVKVMRRKQRAIERGSIIENTQIKLESKRLESM